MPTTTERNKKILQIIEEYTKHATASPKIARETLIREGIYTKNGQLRVEYGGPRTKKKAQGSMA